jgi:hypothetical protein
MGFTLEDHIKRPGHFIFGFRIPEDAAIKSKNLQNYVNVEYLSDFLKVEGFEKCDLNDSNPLGPRVFVYYDKRRNTFEELLRLLKNKNTANPDLSIRALYPCGEYHYQFAKEPDFIENLLKDHDNYWKHMKEHVTELMVDAKLKEAEERCLLDLNH